MHCVEADANPSPSVEGLLKKIMASMRHKSPLNCDGLLRGIQNTEYSIFLSQRKQPKAGMQMNGQAIFSASDAYQTRCIHCLVRYAVTFQRLYV
jgi:hypothetical protein